jgi:uncharacterized protein YbjT (DUF2867 family)
VRAWSRELREIGFRHPRLELIAGDVRDAQVTRDALVGVDAVLSALGSQEGLKPTTLCADATRVLLPEMKAAGVRRILVVTSLATTQKLGPFVGKVLDPLLLHNIYADKREQERLLFESDTDWTVARPGRLTDGPDDGSSVAVLTGALPGFSISRRAVARFLVEQVDSARYVGKAPYLVEKMSVPWHRLVTFGFDARPV